MSAHLNRDSLWELAMAAHLPVETQAHLSTCGDCQVQLASVKQAQALLQFRRTTPPPLNPIAARRIQAVLKEAAEQRLSPGSGWFSFRWGWAFAAVTAAVLAFFVWNQNPLPLPQEQLAKEVPPQVTPAPVPEVAPAPPRPKLLAKVTGAKKAKGKDGKLLKAQTVAEGTAVATEAGGALWLALPDGSRAGLTGSTEVAIDKLEDKALGFTLNKGNLMMVAKHLPERLMTVKAGEIEVRDIGTRFLVSRDVDRVLVAVEEGMVEVSAPGTRTTLKAGRSLEWREGQLREQAWAPAPPPVAKAVAKVEPQSPAPVAIEVADAGQSVVVAAPQYVNPDDEWAAPPNLPKTAVAEPTAPPNAGTEAEPPVYEAPAPPEDEEASVLSLAGLEQRLKRVARAVQAPFAAVGASLRETRSRDIGRLADEGACEEALKRAEVWLADRPSNSNAEPRWRRAVMVNQMRCYNRLKRTEDANRIKAKLE